MILFTLFGASLAVSISGALFFGSLLMIMAAFRVARPSSAVVLRPSPLDWPLAFYFLWSLVCVLINGSATFAKAFSGQSAILSFFLFAHAVTMDQIKSAFKGFVVASALMGLLCVIQSVSGINYLPNETQYRVPELLSKLPDWVIEILAVRNERAVATRSHPLTLAEGLMPAFFLLGVLLHQYLARMERRSIMRVGIALLFVSAGLLLAQGRGVWIGLVVGLVFLFPLFPRRVIFGGLAAASLIMIGVISVSPSLRARAVSTVSWTGGREGDQDSKSTRFVLWAQSVELIQERPWVGVGYRGVSLHAPDPVHKVMKKFTETHNIFLQTAVENGLVGLGLFLWVLIAAGWCIWQSPPPWKQGFAAIFIAFLLAGVSESWTRDKEVAMIFWAFLGGTEFVRRHFKERRNEK